MRLLYVLHQFFPEAYSGTEQYVLACAREGKRRGHDVTIASLFPDPSFPEPPVHVYREDYDGFPVVRIRHWEGLLRNETLRDFHDPHLRASFARILGEVRPDAVHFFHLRNLGVDFLLAADEMRLRTVVHLMDFWYLCPRFNLLRGDGTLCFGAPEGGIGCISCVRPDLVEGETPSGPFPKSRALAAAGRFPSAEPSPADVASALARRPAFLREALSRARAVFAPSRFLRDLFVRNGFPEGRIRLVPYGIPRERFSPPPVERPRTPLRLLFAGVLSPWKGALVLVEAARRVHGEFELSLYSRMEEDMFRPYISRVRETAKGDSRIRFRGMYERDRAASVFGEADLLVLPSLWHENTPFVALEALACGLPVLGSDVGGIAEIVREGENGALFPRGDVEALSKRLQEFVDRPARIAELRPRAQGWLEEAFDRFEEAYRTGP
ncbi:MAG TPA: glycosyltransferase family 4 protein [Planctomycetota bacterium]|nr:glycosyltransferase family 4 protein [Planctomycetota bacterium]